MKIKFELEDNETWITPLKVAEALINSGEEIETSSFQQRLFGIEKVNHNTFDCDDLMEIAGNLQVYCKYNKMYGECEEQTNMKKSCENCKYLFEGKNGEHCKNCIHNAKDNFEPMEKRNGVIDIEQCCLHGSYERRI